MRTPAPTPPRIMRLRDMRTPPYGHAWVVACQRCGYTWPLPLSGMLRQHSEFTPLQHGVEALTCSQCDAQGQAKTTLQRKTA